jgi:hypothetical protein
MSVPNRFLQHSFDQHIRPADFQAVNVGRRNQELFSIESIRSPCHLQLVHRVPTDRSIS